MLAPAFCLNLRMDCKVIDCNGNANECTQKQGCAGCGRICSTQKSHSEACEQEAPHLLGHHNLHEDCEANELHCAASCVQTSHDPRPAVRQVLKGIAEQGAAVQTCHCKQTKQRAQNCHFREVDVTDTLHICIFCTLVSLCHHTGHDCESQGNGILTKYCERNSKTHCRANTVCGWLHVQATRQIRLP